LSAIHPRYRVPHRAELAVGAVVATVAALADVRSAIGFSSFAVLIYYSIANAAAWTLAPEQRRSSRGLSVVGLIGCVLLAFTLPLPSLLWGAAVLGAGAIVSSIVARRS